MNVCSLNEKHRFFVHPMKNCLDEYLECWSSLGFGQ